MPSSARPRGEVDDPALVGDRQQRAPDADLARLGHRPGTLRARATWRGLPGSTVDARRGRSAATTAGEQLVLERAQRARGPPPRRLASGSSIARWAMIGPVSTPSSTKCTVTPNDLHAVGDGLLDRADAGERRQQRRVDVDHALREAREERRVEQLHVAGEHDELDAALLQPVGDRGVARARGRRTRRPRTTRAGTPASARPLRAPARRACPSRRRRPRRRRARGPGRGCACRFEPSPEARTPTFTPPPAPGSGRRSSVIVPASSSASTRSSTAGPARWPKAP